MPRPDERPRPERERGGSRPNGGPRRDDRFRQGGPKPAQGQPGQGRSGPGQPGRDRHGPGAPAQRNRSDGEFRRDRHDRDRSEPSRPHGSFASTERPARDRQPDPDSPFAKLLALKAELEGRSKKDS